MNAPVNLVRHVDQHGGAPARSVAVGRQAVVDRDGRVMGYELLYRPLLDGAPIPSGDQMTADVVLGALTIGMSQLVGDKVVFCNAERGVLTGATPFTLPPHRTIIEVLETVAVDDEVIAGCTALVARGYRLALDDFVWVEGAERLLALASLVKIDVRACTRAEVEELALRCAPYGVELVAEKLETDDEVAWARTVGFDYFQGYAIERPEVVRSSSLPASVAAHVELAATMLTEDIDLDELEQLLRREPGLVVQVLQLAALGAGYGLRRDLQTLREALMLLGTVRIRQWIALTLLAGRPGAGPDALATALVRARACELLVTSRGVGDPALAFTGGLLSTLDLLLGVPLEEVATSFDLPAAVANAAFQHTGPVGTVIAEVAAYQADVARRRTARHSSDLDAACAAAFAWAMPFVDTLTDSSAG